MPNTSIFHGINNINLYSYKDGGVKKLSWYKKEARRIFQMWIRMRDADDNGYVTCCTCGVKGLWNDGFDAGHFIPANHLAVCFDERNVHAQCKGCNGFGMKHRDTQHSYDEFMELKYGREVIIELRTKRHRVVKMKREDYEEIIDKYTDACAGMELTKCL